jgi:hypothetical protein
MSEPADRAGVGKPCKERTRLRGCGPAAQPWSYTEWQDNDRQPTMEPYGSRNYDACRADCFKPENATRARLPLLVG